MPQEKNASRLPIDRVEIMKSQGLSEKQIIENLKKENYSNQEISDALEQSAISYSINQKPYEESIDFPSPPSPSAPSAAIQEPQFKPNFTQQFQTPQPSYFDQSPRFNIDRIEEIAESIINEKWSELTREFGDINSWKDKVATEILSIKQEVIRTQERFENLQKAVFGKVNEYNESVISVSTEMKALEKVLERIINPLTTNIKELNKITEEMKGRKK